MNHRLLLRFALLMWGVPLLAATVALYGFALLRGPAFVASGAVLVFAGGLCLTAGIIAVLAILTTRNSFRETPRRYYKKRALAVLGLLLANLPIAAGYAWIAGRLLERSPVQALPSPSGGYLAEVILLEAEDRPAYGLGVTLRPRPGAFVNSARTVVFSGYCLKGPTVTWQGDHQLHIACDGATAVARRLERYRGIELSYRVAPARPRFER
jgi:hypothetical protein